MEKGINLLEGLKKDISARQQRWVSLARTGSLVLLVLYCLVILGVFSFWATSRRAAQEMEQEMATKKEKIADLKHIESLQVLLKHRLSSLRGLLSGEAPDYGKFLSYFRQFSPNEVALREISLSENGKAALSGEATNGVVLSSFLDNVSDESNPLFSRVVLTSLVRREDGSYLFGLGLQVKGKNAT